MTRVRWGTLGVAKIATTQMIPAMRDSPSARMAAIASRDQARARSAAEALGLDRAYGSYDALLADTDIDAVYIPLPNHLHVRWAIRALDAGKHVLCEKPLGLDAADADALATAGARHPTLKLMEAFMYRFHPQWQRARALILDDAIGQLRSVHTTFTYFNDRADNIRNRVDMGGGALMDIGCYGISVARFLFDAEPIRVFGASQFDPRYGIDCLTSALLEFTHGVSTMTCGTQLTPYQRVEIIGTKGRIVIPVPFNPPPASTSTLLLARGLAEDVLSFPPANQFALEIEAFSQAVANDTPVPTPIADGVANMRVVDAIRRSAEER